MQKVKSTYTSVTCMDKNAVVSLAAINDGSTIALAYTDSDGFEQTLMLSPQDINLLIVALQEFSQGEEDENHQGKGQPENRGGACGNG